MALSLPHRLIVNQTEVMVGYAALTIVGIRMLTKRSQRQVEIKLCTICAFYKFLQRYTLAQNSTRVTALGLRFRRRCLRFLDWCLRQ
jgi:hypothetical protein